MSGASPSSPPSFRDRFTLTAEKGVLWKIDLKPRASISPSVGGSIYYGSFTFGDTSELSCHSSRNASATSHRRGWRLTAQVFHFFSSMTHTFERN
jgi:hypothetical protein